MANHLISIIIPVFNGGKTLKNCLESVSKLSNQDYECIVVDDHSYDDTPEIAEAFKTKMIRLDRQWGAAYARNKGAEAAQGDILLFIDADVTIYPDCLDKVINKFKENPEISALFGSYDDKPGSLNFISQYRNLFHHYIHQTSRKEASTFWTACGAIKREVFFDIGMFNEKTRMMEDIELGYKLKAKNYNIHLVKELFVKHLKQYSFCYLLRTDLFDRAVPWTILILSNKQTFSDLNLKRGHKISAVILVFLLISLFLAARSIWFLSAMPVLLTAFFLINQGYYKFYIKKRGIIFSLRVIPFHFLYYLSSTLGFLIGSYKYYLSKSHSY